MCKVLVVGAGGLGCEILKDLALSGFKNIHVIDMDTIDVSNLNRQFLFREGDVGKSKAEVAANFVNNRVAGCNVVAHNCMIQDKSPQFYQQFQIVVCGLDSIQARRWLNSMISDGNVDQFTVLPLIDGGTEGFKGNARVILPHMTACVECTLDLYPPQVNFPMCTIANTPRLPEHCIEYVKVVMWDKMKPFMDDSLDADNPLHVQWVFEQALQRSKQFNIDGVTLRLTLGVLKRIIPAVASTNAVIAGVCALEALKLASNISLPLNNYVNFQDVTGVNFSVVSLDRNPNCMVCGSGVKTLQVESTEVSFADLLTELRRQFSIFNPHMIHNGDAVIFTTSSLMPELKEQSETSLSKSLSQMGLANGTTLLVTDSKLPKPLSIRLKLAT